jgi:hypothetical protein
MAWKNPATSPSSSTARTGWKRCRYRRAVCSACGASSAAPSAVTVRQSRSRHRAAGLDRPRLDADLGSVSARDHDSIRRDRDDLAERALTGGHRSEAQVPGDRHVVDPYPSGQPGQGSHLGAEDQNAVRGQAPVQRLDPERVTGQVQELFQLVNQGDGEHAAQFGQGLVAELGPQLRDDLPVAGRGDRKLESLY